jgi:hypothetical protein
MAYTIEDDIAAYRAMRVDLETRFMGKWVLFHECKFFGAYDSFDEAAGEAVRAFGRGPYLIQQVGAPPLTLPASVMFQSTGG